MGINDYSSTPNENTTINGINIDEGCPPGNINDAIRQQMADLKDALQDSPTDTTPGRLAIVDSIGDLTGAVIGFAMSAAPSGWLKANGAAVSRTTYARLFTAIGTTWGAGDGSTTFNLPDLRGEFPRGWDDGRGVDSGRAFGSAQSERVADHKHRTAIGFADTNLIMHGDASNQPIYGSDTATGARRADISHGGFTSSQTVRRAYTDNPLNNDTDDDNRPRNVALLYCIKY